MRRKLGEWIPADDEAAETEAQWYYDFGNCVAAALKTCTARRWAAGGGARAAAACEPKNFCEQTIESGRITA